MQDPNSPEVQKEIEAQFKEFYAAMKTLREIPEFKLFMGRLEQYATATKDRVMVTKNFEDITKLQIYYNFLTDLLAIANEQEPNN